jgi:predicted metal-dependent RNase
MSNRISGAPIHLHIDDELFNLVVTGGFIETY